MDILSKFDGSKIAEVEDLTIENLNTSATSSKSIQISKFNDTVIQCLDSLVEDTELLTIMSKETGKTLSACRTEIRVTIYQCRYGFFPEVIKTMTSGNVRLDSMKIFDHIIIESSLPVYTMIDGVFNSLKLKHKIILVHNSVAPTTSMTLSSKIYEKYPETGDLLLDILDNDVLQKIDRKFMNSNITVWGTPEEVRMVQNSIGRNRVLWKPIGNVVSIVEDRQRLEMASNSLATTSYNTISNRGLRNQLFLVSDKNYVFFKNRVIEFLKRDIRKGYGPEGDINYFCNPMDAERSRDAVKDLISSGFNYNEGLHEGVHLLDNQYGNDFPEMPHISGPVIAIMHYSNMEQAVEICAKFPDRMFVNIFSDNLAKMDFVNETEGGNSKILRNVENSKNLISYL